MTEALHKVFLYGTLKRNQPFAGLVRERKEFISFYGCGITSLKLPLVVVTKYNYPYLLDAKGQGKNVHGEIYLVDSELLSLMDEAEFSLCYQREELEILLLSDDEDKDISEMERTEKCWVYTITNFKREFLDLPFLDNYDAYGSHGFPLNPGKNEDYGKLLKESSQLVDGLPPPIKQHSLQGIILASFEPQLNIVTTD